MAPSQYNQYILVWLASDVENYKQVHVSYLIYPLLKNQNYQITNVFFSISKTHSILNEIKNLKKIHISVK